MPMNQQHVNPATALGVNPVAAGGYTFKVWAPNSTKVHAVGTFNNWQCDDSSLMVKDGHDIWGGYHPAAAPGDRYMFYVEGPGYAGEKRDPLARELTVYPAWPDCFCVIVDPDSYVWRKQDFQAPERSEMIIYQLHVGSFWGPDRPSRVAKFLDIADRVEHLAELGVNVVQLLPVAEFLTPNSMGYNGVDLFSAEMDYEVSDDHHLQAYLDKINPLFTARGCAPVPLDQARGSYNQLKILIDLFHVFDIAVVLDVVYNHAGSPVDERSMLVLDKPDPYKHRSLYFCDKDHCGPVFDFSKGQVRDFLISNALFLFDELHVDGLRFDQVSVIDHDGAPHGWGFCRELTEAVMKQYPNALLNAEYWGVNPWVVKRRQDGGAGFNATQHDGIRRSVRAAVKNAAYGMTSPVSMDAIAEALHHRGFAFDQVVTAICTHDIVYAGEGMDRDERIPKLADGWNAWSWYARSRARAAHGILMTSPGIPMLFMGQDLLETKRWHDSRQEHHLVWWDGLDTNVKTVADFVRFVRELIALRAGYRVLREGWVDPYHVHNDNRILAFRRGLDNEPEAVVVASLNDTTFYGYDIGFPRHGGWREVFNSDVYDNWVNPHCAGNCGHVHAEGAPMHRMPCSARITIPANSVSVFVKE